MKKIYWEDKTRLPFFPYISKKWSAASPGFSFSSCISPVSSYRHRSPLVFTVWTYLLVKL
ncbi:MAG: hypothetical protein LIP04_14580 [Tannerellaceae bacterium]|nr:hypothetical protein [Tannerellaceae bacterium]